MLLSEHILIKDLPRALSTWSTTPEYTNGLLSESDNLGTATRALRSPSTNKLPDCSVCAANAPISAYWKYGESWYVNSP